MKRNEDGFRDLWDNIKHTKIHIKFQKEKREEKSLRTYLKT